MIADASSVKLYLIPIVLLACKPLLCVCQVSRHADASTLKATPLALSSNSCCFLVPAAATMWQCPSTNLNHISSLELDAAAFHRVRVLQGTAERSWYRWQLCLLFDMRCAAAASACMACRTVNSSQHR
jgi:hypothetical protein